MTEKYILLIKNHIEKLDDKDFEFESWKKTAILLLESMYKKENNKIKALKEIKYDQSSWSLRDSSGKESFVEMAKHSGKGVMEAVIAELETIGLPDETASQMQGVEFVIDIIKDALTGSQIRELKSIIENSDENKEELIKKRLKTWGSEVPLDIVAKIISIPEITLKL